jgi:hypothetical protein
MTHRPEDEAAERALLAHALLASELANLPDEAEGRDDLARRVLHARAEADAAVALAVAAAGAVPVT